MKCLLLLELFLMIFCAATASALPSDRLEQVKNFAYAAGPGAFEGDYISRLGKFDLVIVDAEEATSRQVRELKSRGVIVLGLLTVGTIEPWRSWYKQVKHARLKFTPEWGEWIADTRSKKFRSVIVKKVAPRLLRKGFDGLFLDHFSVIDERPKLRASMHKLVRELSHLVHRRNGLLFVQNGEKSLAPIIPYIDGWNREVLTSTYNFYELTHHTLTPEQSAESLAMLQQLAAKGVFTMVTDYAEAKDEAMVQSCVQTACALGALPYVTDIELTRIPAEPFECPVTAP